MALSSSTRTVKVEAFAFKAEDLKFVGNQFRRLHSKKLQHTFRFYSHHWRNWAACLAAWLRYKRRAMENHLIPVESKQSDEEKEVEVGEEECVGLSPKAKMNIGVMVLASPLQLIQDVVLQLKGVGLKKFRSKSKL